MARTLAQRELKILECRSAMSGNTQQTDLIAIHQRDPCARDVGLTWAGIPHCVRVP